MDYGYRYIQFQKREIRIKSTDILAASPKVEVDQSQHVKHNTFRHRIMKITNMNHSTKILK